MPKILRLPGFIDIHVHLRDPGQTNKEDFYTGTCAAIAGGVTSVFDMPNNLEPIFSIEALEKKEREAREKAVCDYGLYFGTDGKNTELFEKVARRVVGLKLYLSLTTGKYVVGNPDLVSLIFKKWPKK
ncbi:MAG: amidohydrolase family protein, partial [Patescibacteria group bacterium]|nr:amidohydrolase family protein [Patescibacteria group bacterium]